MYGDKCEVTFGAVVGVARLATDGHILICFSSKKEGEQEFTFIRQSVSTNIFFAYREFCAKNSQRF